MQQIFVLNVEQNVSVSEEVKRELLWYDHKKKKMLKFVGGQLFFEYGYDKELDEYRLLPKVGAMTVKKVERISSQQAVKDWFDIYSRYNDTEAEKSNEQGDGIVFDVPNKETDAFCYSLERQGIQYRVL